MKGWIKIAMLVAVPTAAWAQLTLVTFDGTTQTPVGATYNFGSVASGSTENVVIRALNTGTSPIAINSAALTVSGAGFTIASVNGTFANGPSCPQTFCYTIAPAGFLAFTVQFSAGPPLSYSAGLLVESISVILLANSIAEATVSSVSPCSPTSSNGFSFGSLQNGSQHMCSFAVSNGNSQAVTISNIAVTGAFQASQLPATPLTLAPGQAIPFSIQIAPACGIGLVTGTLIINTNSYALTGQGADPPLPKPVLTLDAPTIGSGEQHALTMSLASPAVCAALGSVSLAFASAKSLPVTDDTSIVFLSGSTRSLQFSVSAGASTVLIDGQSSAEFQTGTTAGTITFSVSGTPSISFTIAPATISIETVTASNQITGQLDVAVVGYDNTYSAGAMTFTFFDANNHMIGSPVTANFASNFQSYFATNTSGSTFLARISFPVQGNALLVATVAVTLSNSAGQAQTGTLTFQ